MRQEQGLGPTAYDQFGVNKRIVLRTIAYFALISAVAAGAGTVSAETLTVGQYGNHLPDDIPQEEPFSGSVTQTREGIPIEYQQVYAASLFPGSISITALSFLAVEQMQSFPPLYPRRGNFSVSLSVTGLGPGSLTRSLEANLGTGIQPFGTVTPADVQVLTVTGAAPYLYDPLQGNLLMTVISYDATWQGSSRNCCWNFQADSSGTVMSSLRIGEAYLYGSPPETISPSALVTRFTYETSAPEPSPAALLLVAGVSTLFLLRRKNRYS